MVRVFAVLVLVFLANTASAVKITQDDIIQMVGRMQSIMNQRTISGIEKYFGYYADSEARFLKTSYLVDPDNSEKILAQESLNMSRDEYIKYIKNILNPPTNYVYKATVNSVKMDDIVNQALVSYSTQEYATINVLDSTYNKVAEETSLIRSNCNMIVDYNSTDIVILSINCAEKITRRKAK